MKTISSRDFNQHVSVYKKEAANGPVFITDRGRTAHVLLSIEDYNKLIGDKEDIVSLLSMDEAAEIDFEAPKSNIDLSGKVEFD